jgi:hypothetical protein
VIENARALRARTSCFSSRSALAPGPPAGTATRRCCRKLLTRPARTRRCNLCSAQWL